LHVRVWAGLVVAALAAAMAGPVAAGQVGGPGEGAVSLVVYLRDASLVEYRGLYVERDLEVRIYPGPDPGNFTVRLSDTSVGGVLLIVLAGDLESMPQGQTVNIELENTSASTIIVVGPLNILLDNVRAGGLTGLGYLNLTVRGSTLGSFTAATPVLGQHAYGYRVWIWNSTLGCVTPGSEGRVEVYLGDNPGVEPRLSMVDVRLGCSNETSMVVEAYVYGSAFISGLSQAAHTVSMSLYNLRGASSMLDSAIQGSLTVYGDPQARATILISNTSITPGGGQEPGRLGLYNVEAGIVDSRITVDRFEAEAPVVEVVGSLLTGYSAATTGLRLLTINSTLASFQRWEASTLAVEGGNATLQIAASTLTLYEPLRVVARANTTIVLENTSMQDGVAVRAENTMVELVLRGVRVTRASAVFTVYALPPSQGVGRIVAESSYFASPLGPTVTVNGTILREGGALLSLLAVPGSIVLDTWLASPSGPLLRDLWLEDPIRVEGDGVADTLPVMVLVGGEWRTGLLVVFDDLVRQATLTLSPGYNVSMVLTGAGGGGFRVEAGPGGGLTVDISLPAYTDYIILVLEPVQEAARPVDTATVAPSTTSTTAPDNVGGGRGLLPVILGLAALALVLAAGYWYSVRGRR